MDKIALILVLHILAAATFAGKFKLTNKVWGLIGVGVYFLSFYLIFGLWLSKDPDRLVPEKSMKSDYYWVPPKKLPTFFQDLPPMPGGYQRKDNE